MGADDRTIAVPSAVIDRRHSLRLTVSDGQLTSSDDVVVTVNA